jgi:hypothetical protein
MTTSSKREFKYTTDTIPDEMSPISKKDNSFLSMFSSSPKKSVKFFSDSKSDSKSVSDSISKGTSVIANSDNYIWWIVGGIILLAMIGINIFTYLAKGTETTTSLFLPIYNWFSYQVGRILVFFGFAGLETTKQTVQTSATGTKAGVDVVSNVTTGTINAVENPMAPVSDFVPGAITSTGLDGHGQSKVTDTATPIGPTPSPTTLGGKKQNVVNYETNTLNAALQNASASQGQSYPVPTQSAGKSGWCYTGMDQGFRNCAPVGANDICMSGDIFPSQDICINPNLRTK